MFGSGELKWEDGFKENCPRSQKGNNMQMERSTRKQDLVPKCSKHAISLPSPYMKSMQYLSGAVCGQLVMAVLY